MRISLTDPDAPGTLDDAEAANAARQCGNGEFYTLAAVVLIALLAAAGFGVGHIVRRVLRHRRKAEG